MMYHFLGSLGCCKVTKTTGLQEQKIGPFTSNVTKEYLPINPLKEGTANRKPVSHNHIPPLPSSLHDAMVRFTRKPRARMTGRSSLPSAEILL